MVTGLLSRLVHLDWTPSGPPSTITNIEVVIATHARDRRVAAWFQDTAQALKEIGKIDLAIDWARQRVDIGPWHQSPDGRRLRVHVTQRPPPAELQNARVIVFRR